MKPRDRRQFAAVVRAFTPDERRAALVQVLARLGRWRERRLGLEHVRMAPIHVLAGAATGARMQGEQLLIELTHGRMILEPGADWDAQTGDLRDLAVLFRRVRLDWYGRTLSLTLEGRPDTFGIRLARGPDVDVVLTDAGPFEHIDGQTGQTYSLPASGLGLPLGVFVLDRLARLLAWHAPITSSPALRAVQLEGDADSWMIYADWLRAQGDPRAQAFCADGEHPLTWAAPVLAAWMASPASGALRRDLRWRNGHLIEAEIHPLQGPEMTSLAQAVLDGPESVALRVLTLETQDEADAVMRCLVHRKRPAMRQLCWTDYLARRQMKLQDLLDACPHLERLELPHFWAHQPMRSVSLRALRLGGTTLESVGDWSLPALISLDVEAGGPLDWVTNPAVLPRLRTLVLRQARLNDTPAWRDLFGRLARVHLVDCTVDDALVALLSERFGSWRTPVDSDVFWDV